MPTLTIDNRTVTVPPGATLLEAARQLGIAIPTLCHRDGLPPQTTCMVCVVRVRGHDRFLPACSTRATDGMAVESEVPEVHAERRRALELLASDHAGDCVAPCELACPAGLPAPRLLRHIASGERAAAGDLARAHLLLPGVLARVCPAPCERACRRTPAGGAVTIRALHGWAADDTAAGPPHPAAAPSGRRVAVIGAGPAGVAAAAELVRLGHTCDLYERDPAAGGALRGADVARRLPPGLLDRELTGALGGVTLQLRAPCDAEGLARLQHDYDAVVLAVGSREAAQRLGLPLDERGVATEGPRVHGASNLFAAGGVRRPERLAVRAIASGRDAARAVDGWLRQATPAASPAAHAFRTRYGKLDDNELAALLALADPAARGPDGAALDATDARREAARCLHCDCRKADTCRLRRWGDAYGADPLACAGTRPAVRVDTGHPDLVFEPAKCIKCGLCVAIARRDQRTPGVGFTGRGFPARVETPFVGETAAGLGDSARACADACPTGALAWRARPG